ncbi:MAG TPA: tetratricopeptide repeat protein [Caulobacteraceae bacterium]
MAESRGVRGRRLLVCGLAWTFLTAAPPALADPSIAPSASAALPDAATLQGDERAVDEAGRAAREGGIIALKEHLSALQKVLADIPTPYAKAEERAGVLYYRTDDMQDMVVFSGQEAAARKASGRPAVNITQIPDPYPTAAFFVGSYFNETGKPEAALAALETGLQLDPRNPYLVSEKGAALSLLHRWQDALGTYAAGLAQLGLIPRPTDQARLLRGEGFALTELKRYDEAEKAYRESLKFEPAHGGALSELAYIARVRAGAPPSATMLFNGVNAKARKPSTPPP